MHNIPEAAARAFLENQHYCEDIGCWEPQRTQSDTFMISSGVIDEDGIGQDDVQGWSKNQNEALFIHNFPT
jgi:hypothetical protein